MAVVIVLVLMGLVIGGMGRIRERAKETETASRLRQVFTLQMLYSQEHHSRITPFYNNDDTQSNPITWQELLLPYLDQAAIAGAKEDPRLVLNSPYQVREEGKPYSRQGRSFGLNNYMAHGNWRYYLMRIPETSRVVLAGDMVQANVDFINTSDGANWYSDGGASWGLPAYRHNGREKAMFVFFDGHVELLSYEDLLVNPDGGRTSVWKWW